MNLLRLVGLAKPPTADQIGDDGRAILVLRAEQALRAGVVLSPDFWSGCEDYEREALAQAGDRIAASRAALLAAAMQGLRQAAMVASHEDGGKALESVDVAEEVARNRAAADAALAGFNGESALTRLPTEVAR